MHQNQLTHQQLVHQQQLQQQKQSIAYQKQRAMSDETGGKVPSASISQQQQMHKNYQQQRYHYAQQEGQYHQEQQQPNSVHQNHYLMKAQEKKPTHRRSKTDGNVGPQQLPASLLQPQSSSLSQFKATYGQSPHDLRDLRQNNKLGANLITNLNQLAAAQAQQVNPQGVFVSRQAAINNRLPGQPGFGMIAQASGQSAQSAGAHLQQMKIAQGQSRQVVAAESKSKSGGTGGASLRQQNTQQRQQSVEQAAKNLRLRHPGGEDPSQAATRNSNLMSQPKKDKLRQEMFAGDQQQVVSAASHQSHSPHLKKEISMRVATQQRPIEQAAIIAQNQSSNLLPVQKAKRDPPATVPRPHQVQHPDSIQPSSTGSLSKNSSAASHKVPENLEHYKLKLKQLMKNPQIAQFLKEQLELQEQQQQQHFPNQPAPPVQPQPALVCSESNMNSDTSQEILRYQKEWAKQFHEHVNNAGSTHQKDDSQNYAQQSVQTQQTGEPRAEKSREQIVLPDSLNARNMQNLNKGNMGAAIDFYQRQESDGESDCNVTRSSAKKHMEQENIEYIPASHSEAIFDMHPDGNEVQNEAGGGFIPTEQTDSQVMQMVQPQQSRNIMNDGKQLSFMTVCSDVMDHSAELDLGVLPEDSNASQKDEEEEYLTFQLCDGEEMNNEMANFIGIHMLNDGCLESGDDGANPEADNDGGGLTYQCPETGSHFEHNDIVGRIGLLSEKRRVLDEAIRQEDERQKVLKKQRRWENSAQQDDQQRQRQKQIEKQKRQKTQVQNILKQAAPNPADDISGDDLGLLHDDDMDDGSQVQQSNRRLVDQGEHGVIGQEPGTASDEGKLSSMQHAVIRSSGIAVDDEDLLMLAEDESHLQSHHIQPSLRPHGQQPQAHHRMPPTAVGKMRGAPVLFEAQSDAREGHHLVPQWANGGAATSGSGAKPGTKIYNTHDGRQQKHLPQSIVDEVTSPEVIQMSRAEVEDEVQQRAAPGQRQWIRPNEADKKVVVHSNQLGVARPKPKKQSQIQQTLEHQKTKPAHGKSTGFSSYIPQQPMVNMKSNSIKNSKAMAKTFHHHAASQVTTNSNTGQMHQAGSLAADHASKISQISIGSGGPRSNQLGDSHGTMIRGVEFNHQGATKMNQQKQLAFQQHGQSSSNERQQNRKFGPTSATAGQLGNNGPFSATSGAQKKFVKTASSNEHHSTGTATTSQYNKPKLPSQQIAQKLKKPFSGAPGGGLKLQQQAEFTGFAHHTSHQQPNRALSGGQTGYASNTSAGPAASTNSQMRQQQQYQRPQDNNDQQVQFNTGNLKKGLTYQTFYQSGTHAVNTNPLSSLKGTNNFNTNQLHTALASHRGEPDLAAAMDGSQQFQPGKQQNTGQRILTVVHGTKIKKHAPTSSMDSNVTGQMAAAGQTFEHRPSKPSFVLPQAQAKKSQQSSSQQPISNEVVDMHQSSSFQQRPGIDAPSLRQTAQFGPQMNLIKSSLQNNGMNSGVLQSKAHGSQLGTGKISAYASHQPVSINQTMYNSNQQHSKPIHGVPMTTTKPLRGGHQKKPSTTIAAQKTGKSADQRMANSKPTPTYIADQQQELPEHAYHDEILKRDSLISYDPGASSATTEELFSGISGAKRGAKPTMDSQASVSRELGAHPQGAKVRTATQKQLDHQIELKNQMVYGGMQPPQTVQPSSKKYAINMQQAQPSNTLKQRTSKATGHAQSYSFDFREQMAPGTQSSKPQQAYAGHQGSSGHLQQVSQQPGGEDRNPSALQQHPGVYQQSSQPRQRPSESAYQPVSQQQMKIKSSSLSQRKELRPTQLQESIGDYEQGSGPATQVHVETEKTPKGQQLLLHGNHFSQQNQQIIATPNNATVKSKRLTAATRGANNGTNARVNTFDNRAGQPNIGGQKMVSNQNNTKILPQMMTSTVAQNTLTSSQLMQQKRMQASKYIRKSHQNQIQHHYNQMTDQEYGPPLNELEVQQEMDYRAMQQRQESEGKDSAGQQPMPDRQLYTQQVNQQMGRASAASMQQSSPMQMNNGQMVTKPSKSPKKNIYLLNFQGNVSIV